RCSVQHARGCVRGRARSQIARTQKMDLNYTTEDEAYRQRVRAWFVAHRARSESVEDRKAWQRTLYDAGFVGMGWPREYGGQDARPMEQAIVAEEMARADLPGAINSLALGQIGPPLIVHGSDDPKRRYVRRMWTAEAIW